MTVQSTLEGAPDANSPFALLMQVVGHLHDPEVPFNPASTHDLARVATNGSILQGLHVQLQVRQQSLVPSISFQVSSLTRRPDAD